MTKSCKHPEKLGDFLEKHECQHQCKNNRKQEDTVVLQSERKHFQKISAKGAIKPGDILF